MFSPPFPLPPPHKKKKGNFLQLLWSYLKFVYASQKRIFLAAGSEAKKRDMFERTSTSELIVNNVELKDLPLFKLEKLAVATKYFHLSNKLGEGGFGPVFKVIDCRVAYSNQITT